jgi:uncharacterized protein YjbI with pentapeptide repeats
MANEEHLKILRRGVEVWNQWRKDSPEIEPDLQGAELQGVNLHQAHLGRVNFSKANLINANLSSADFSRANLNEAALNMANLQRAYLGNAVLTNAYLIEANLYKADLIRANLSGADLSGAILRRATLREANLSETNLTRADLRRVDSQQANLRNADLQQANLRHADLQQANLQRTKLQKANLQTSRLINANLDGANLTGACLWETLRAGWSIKEGICEYIYWDECGTEKTVYAPGEFERLYADQTKIKLFYKDGITPLEIATLPALIQHLSDSHPGCNLRFVSIQEVGGGAVVELAVEETENLNSEQIKQLKASLETEAQRQVEYQKQVLIERTMRLQLEKQLDSFVDKLILRQGNTFINNGQAGAMGDNSQAHDSTLNQIVNAENSSVESQIQGERNIAIADASDSNISTGDKNSIESE